MRQERRQKKQNALILNIIIDIKTKLKIKVDVDEWQKVIGFYWFESFQG